MLHVGGDPVGLFDKGGHDLGLGHVSRNSIALRVPRPAPHEPAPPIVVTPARPKTEIERFAGVELTSVINMMDLEAQGAQPLVDLDGEPVTRVGVGLDRPAARRRLGLALEGGDSTREDVSPPGPYRRRGRTLTASSEVREGIHVRSALPFGERG